ncbi:MAG: hypothetical protein B6241_02575 [Spirochaetaceae bacterium 4572_59]|nr:MAG: hypothetical protein B6241_02575 [Spirochaetaceae bacterium 4572_59]
MNPFKRIFKGLSRKYFIILGLVSAGILLLIVGILIVTDLLEDRSINKAEQGKMAYNLENLDKAMASQKQCNMLYFEDLEELFLDMELYRETGHEWTSDDVAEFWIPADRSDIDYFTEANHELIWGILKDVQ